MGKRSKEKTRDRQTSPRRPNQYFDDEEWILKQDAYSIPSRSQDYYAAHQFPVAKRNRGRCRDRRCPKRDFRRAPHLQAVMDRIERRRFRDEEARERSKEQQRQQQRGRQNDNHQGEIDEVLEVFAKYDNILEHMTKKNSRWKAYSKALSGEIPTDTSSCSTEEILDGLDKLKLFKAQKFPSHFPPYVSESRQGREHTRIRWEEMNRVRSKEGTRQATSPSSHEDRDQVLRKAHIRYLKERINRRKANGLHPVDGEYAGRLQQIKERQEIEHKFIHGVSTPVYPEYSQTREFLERSRQKHLEPPEQARQLQGYVDDMYHHSQKLRDSQESMKDDIHQIKHRYVKRQNELNQKYSGNMTNGNGIGYQVRSDGVIVLDDVDDIDPKFATSTKSDQFNPFTDQFPTAVKKEARQQSDTDTDSRGIMPPRNTRRSRSRSPRRKRRVRVRKRRDMIDNDSSDSDSKDYQCEEEDSQKDVHLNYFRRNSECSEASFDVAEEFLKAPSIFAVPCGGMNTIL